MQALPSAFGGVSEPALGGATVEEKKNDEARPVKRWRRGARASVKASTFSHPWAKAKFGSNWKRQKIYGTFHEMMSHDRGLFFWEDGDPPMAQETGGLENVKWYDEGASDEPEAAVDVHALHCARHAMYLMRKDVRTTIRLGIEGLKEDLARKVELAVVDVDQFDMLFGAISGLRDVKETKNPGPVETYSGAVEVKKTRVVYAFTTLKEWVEFIGSADEVLVKHKYKDTHFVGIFPAAMLCKAFDAQHAAHAALVSMNLPPLLTSRASLGNEIVLQSLVGREAAANARDVRVYLLDQIVCDGHEVYLAFVAEGYATSPPLENRAIFGIKVAGHFGYIPKDCVAWTSGCKKIFASWRQTNCLKGGAPLLGGRGDNKPHLKYRPTIIARESGLILQ